jgi:hypothetical protein
MINPSSASLKSAPTQQVVRDDAFEPAEGVVGNDHHRTRCWNTVPIFRFDRVTDAAQIEDILQKFLL